MAIWATTLKAKFLEGYKKEYDQMSMFDSWINNPIQRKSLSCCVYDNADIDFRIDEEDKWSSI